MRLGSAAGQLKVRGLHEHTGQAPLRNSVVDKVGTSPKVVGQPHDAPVVVIIEGVVATDISWSATSYSTGTSDKS